jgi:hypothetical protein
MIRTWTKPTISIDWKIYHNIESNINHKKISLIFHLKSQKTKVLTILAFDDSERFIKLFPISYIILNHWKIYSERIVEYFDFNNKSMMSIKLSNGLQPLQSSKRITSYYYISFSLIHVDIARKLSSTT